MGGSSPNSDFKFFLEILSFLCVFVLFSNVSKKKKMDSGVGGCCLINPSFSRFFGFF